MALAHSDWHRVAIASAAGVCAISLALSLSPLSKYSGVSLPFSKPVWSLSGAPAPPAQSTTTAPSQDAKPQAPKDVADTGRPNPPARPTPRQLEKQRDPGVAEKKVARPYVNAVAGPSGSTTPVETEGPQIGFPQPNIAPSPPPMNANQNPGPKQITIKVPVVSQTGINWKREAAAAAAICKFEQENPGADLDQILSAGMMASEQAGPDPEDVEISEADRMMNAEFLAADMWKQMEEQMPNMTPEQVELAMQHVSEWMQQQDLAKS